jgi:hypothetical protein
VLGGRCLVCVYLGEALSGLTQGSAGCVSSTVLANSSLQCSIDALSSSPGKQEP